MKEFIFSKILAILPVALLKKIFHRYFSRSLIIDLRIPIYRRLKFSKVIIEIISILNKRIPRSAEQIIDNSKFLSSPAKIFA